jgi:hypothetical protein
MDWIASINLDYVVAALVAVAAVYLMPWWGWLVTAVIVVIVISLFGSRLADLIEARTRPPGPAAGFAPMAAFSALAAVAGLLRSVSVTSAAVAGRGADVAVAVVGIVPAALEAMKQPLIAACVFGAIGMTLGYRDGAADWRAKYSEEVEKAKGLAAKVTALDTEVRRLTTSRLSDPPKRR